MHTPYFFFRPILASNRAWSALEWKSSAAGSDSPEDCLRCFAEANLASLAEKMPLVLHLNPEWIEQGAISSDFFAQFNPAHLIFVVPPSVFQAPTTLELFKSLRKKAWHFALSIDRVATAQQASFESFDYLYFDATFAAQEHVQLAPILSDSRPFLKIAHAVRSEATFDLLATYRFDLYGSEFVTEGTPVAAKKPDLGRLKLLKLLTLVVQDADTREIEAVFREEPKLSYNLLKLVNSVAVGSKRSIDSYAQAIALLGRRQLQRWLQLLIYANPSPTPGEPRPLMQLAAARGRQMELLLSAVEPVATLAVGSIPREADDTAFMAGIFSLLDVLLGVPINEIFSDLPLHRSVRDALEGQRGVLGRLLSIISAAEAGDFTAASELLSQLGITPARHATAQIAAFYWASRISLD
ncbi:MAG: HDOD domain-containing protein [Pseudomonadota bacterium]